MGIMYKSCVEYPLCGVAEWRLWI